MKPHVGSPPHALTWQASVAFFAVFALVGALGLGAYQPIFRIESVSSVVPDIYRHTSNLVLSAFLLLGYGIIRVLYAGPLRSIFVVALLVIVGNYGYELALPLWNTKDVVDAHYGAVGAVLAVVYLTGVRHFGLRSNPKHPSQTATKHQASNRSHLRAAVP